MHAGLQPTPPRAPGPASPRGCGVGLGRPSELVKVSHTRARRGAPTSQPTCDRGEARQVSQVPSLSLPRVPPSAKARGHVASPCPGLGYGPSLLATSLTLLPAGLRPQQALPTGICAGPS